MSKILVIEETQEWRNDLKEALGPLHSLRYLPDGKDIGALLRREDYEIVLLSIHLNIKDGFSMLEQIKLVNPHTPVLVLSKTEKADLIVKAIKTGAFDFIAEPFFREKIELSIKRALGDKRLRNEIDYLRRGQDVIYNFDEIIACSSCMKQVIDVLKKFAETDSTILITGETGTGKSFLSGAVHFNSARRNKPFIKINCANIPETLLESELFGHEKGAFTGAVKTRIGRLEQGNGGTVFLDEIAEMTPALQAKLLRVLEEKRFERVGGSKTIYSDARIIAATNKKLEEQIAEGRFRDDLYYRINVLRVHLPSLGERKACISSLAHLFLEKICRKLKKKIKGFSPEAIEVFKSYSWPGNIRELANCIERSVILEESHLIRKKNISIPEPIHPVQPEQAMSKEETFPADSGNWFESQEKEAILTALKESLWIQKEAAKLLGISPRVLNYKIKSFGITHPRWRKNK